MKNAHGSCFVKFGDTHILCSATIEDKVPPFLRNTGSGWLTAEYGMLPCSANERIDREISKGKANPRTQEIQRLIGRALRASLDMKALGERQIKIDCDVLQADGGTRTASITGGFVALYEALRKWVFAKKLPSIPLKGCVAAVSCGILNEDVLLDLDFAEDSNADVDANFIMLSTDKGYKWVEIQASAENETFFDDNLTSMMKFAKEGVESIVKLQKEVLKIS